MAALTYAKERTTTISRAKHVKAFVSESHIRIPKAVPGGIKSVKFLEGDGGVVRVKQTNLVDGGKSQYMKHRSKFEKVEYVVHESKFKAATGGGSICKVTSEYRHVKAEYKLKEEELKKGNLKASGQFKAVKHTESKFKAAPGGGSICKFTSEYHVKAGYELKQEELKKGKPTASGQFKAVKHTRKSA